MPIEDFIITVFCLIERDAQLFTEPYGLGLAHGPGPVWFREKLSIALVLYPRNFKMLVLDDLIFVSAALKKVSNSQLYCEFFSKPQRQKAIVQN